MNFDRALEHILKYEGGLVDHPKDPGGITKYGISLRAYPSLGRGGIRNLNLKTAGDIYRKDYWDALKCDQLPAELRLVVFDCAVNQGVNYAARALQSAASVKSDGILGPITLRAVAASGDVLELVNRFVHNRYLRYRRNRNWETFGDGWMARLLHVTLNTTT